MAFENTNFIKPKGQFDASRRDYALLFRKIFEIMNMAVELNTLAVLN